MLFCFCGVCCGLVFACCPGWFGWRNGGDPRHKSQRVQIKGRAYGQHAKPGQRLGTIKRGAPCDAVLLVLLDNRTLEPREMWEAPIAAVEERLALPGSKARDRGALGVPEFKRLARLVWPGEGRARDGR